VGCDVMGRRRYVRRVVSGKWFGREEVRRNRLVTRWDGARRENRLIPDPPPPTVKGRTGRGGLESPVDHPSVHCQDNRRSVRTC
jgi:hypothetical protein